MEELELIHRELWLKTYKPFGYQKNCCRYGSQIIRLTYTIDRIKDYLGGKIASIPELDEEPLKCIEEDNMTFETENGEVFIDYEKWFLSLMEISL